MITNLLWIDLGVLYFYLYTCTIQGSYWNFFSIRYICISMGCVSCCNGLLDD